MLILEHLGNEKPTICKHTNDVVGLNSRARGNNVIEFFSIVYSDNNLHFIIRRDEQIIVSMKRSLLQKRKV